MKHALLSLSRVRQHQIALWGPRLNCADTKDDTGHDTKSSRTRTGRNANSTETKYFSEIIGSINKSTYRNEAMYNEYPQEQTVCQKHVY